MIKLTTKDLLKILPLEEDLRQSLLKEFDTYDEARKFEISSICWDSFNDMTEKLTEIKVQESLTEIQEGTKELTPQLTEQAKEAVFQDYQDILSGKKADLEQVEEIKSKLQSLINKN